MRLERAWIEAHVPHAGAMCLLDEVIDWNVERIRCRSGTHRRPDHPLGVDGRLGAACAVEYAAQAVALHASLRAATPECAPRAGYMTSVRDLQLHIARLDQIEADLICEAVRIAGDAHGLLYAFTIGGEEPASRGALVSGRLALMLEAGPTGEFA